MNHYIGRSDFEVIQMYTDCKYLAISTDRLKNVARPELRGVFDAEKRQWLDFNF